MLKEIAQQPAAADPKRVVIRNAVRALAETAYNAHPLR
jgi:hypothetical protein